MRLLTVNWVQLVEKIDPSNRFLDDLGVVKCISWSQREYICNIPQNRERNQKLLDFLTRRSMADFGTFINVLHKHQNHLVSLLVTAESKTYFFLCDKINLQ